MRRYWHPVAGVSELECKPVLPLRLMGEDLVLFRTLQGHLGLIGRKCVHRAADLSFGFVAEQGIRCGYHGWHYNLAGECTERPFDETTRPGVAAPVRQLAGYPVKEKAGLVWAYLGPDPAPELPDWDAFHWQHTFAQIAIADVPCNWLQCQENAVDPVHFEWLHNNTPQRQAGDQGPDSPRTLQMHVDDAPWGLLSRRYREGGNTQTPLWKIGRAILWPNGWYFGHHFEWKVPIDDQTTRYIIWSHLRVPRDREPFQQENIPTWHAPLYDDTGELITSHLGNQDIAAWISQGPIADRTEESLGASDVGVVMMRRRLLDDLDAIAHGLDPRALIRTPAHNHRLPLPCIDQDDLRDGLPREQMLTHPLMGPLLQDFYLLAGQPQPVKVAFERAMGVTGAPVDMSRFVPQ